MNFFIALTLIVYSLFTPAFAQQHSQQQHTGHGARENHSFGSEAFERFHDILHPLQHEALPRGDYKTIRARAAELLSAGRAITRMTAPRNTSDTKMFKSKQREFARALANFKRDARRGSDTQLKVSFDSVHDSFEELAEMLPRS